ncbi:MAG: UPF0280 family protein [Syntrophorhabdaceae bacterium]|nr:UPF0280 family protein [Syntrophorhabdaceae bacterium]
MYEERFYRRISKPAELVCYNVQCKETDLFCCTSGDLGPFIKERVLFYRNQLEEYIRTRPSFQDSLLPIEDDRLAPPIAGEMIRAGAVVGVGPMATVAGAVAEFIGRDIMPLTGDFIIENGGDIYLRTSAERTIQIHAGASPFSERIGIKLQPAPDPRGVCTSSGTVGHSLSFGKADAVCVVGRSSLFTDGLATYLGNIVKKKDDIAAAVEKGQRFPGVTGILIILDDQLGAWGDLDIVEL